MTLIETTIDEAKKTITFVMDLETPTLSKSGKRLLVASTRGSKAAGVEIDGRPVFVGINAMIKPG